MIAEFVYVLCGLTSASCAALLLSDFRSSHAKILLWTGATFIGLTINNIALSLDLIFVPEIDLSVCRNFTSALSGLLLLGGLIWERSE